MQHEWKKVWSDPRPAVVNSVAAREMYHRHWHVRCIRGQARICLWSQHSTLVHANMANLRWRCVDLASLAIAFSKRDPPVEMGFQRVCTTIEIIIIMPRCCSGPRRE